MNLDQSGELVISVHLKKKNGNSGMIFHAGGPLYGPAFQGVGEISGLYSEEYIFGLSEKLFQAKSVKGKMDYSILSIEGQIQSHNLP